MGSLQSVTSFADRLSLADKKNGLIKAELISDKKSFRFIRGKFFENGRSYKASNINIF
ncbi:MAG: hypothetical protein WKG06_45880 [Segetibacter sp.]